MEHVEKHEGQKLAVPLPGALVSEVVSILFHMLPFVLHVFAFPQISGEVTEMGQVGKFAKSHETMEKLKTRKTHARMCKLL